MPLPTHVSGHYFSFLHLRISGRFTFVSFLRVYCDYELGRGVNYGLTGEGRGERGLDRDSVEHLRYSFLYICLATKEKTKRKHSRSPSKSPSSDSESEASSSATASSSEEEEKKLKKKRKKKKKKAERKVKESKKNGKQIKERYSNWNTFCIFFH